MIRTRVVFETGKHFGRRQATLTSRVVFRPRPHRARKAKLLARAVAATIRRAARRH